jgi:hypothetical protein
MGRRYSALAMPFVFRGASMWLNLSRYASPWRKITWTRQKCTRPHVRYGSFADISAPVELVRFLTIDGTPLVWSRSLRINDAQNWI